MEFNDAVKHESNFLNHKISFNVWREAHIDQEFFLCYDLRLIVK